MTRISMAAFALLAPVSDALALLPGDSINNVGGVWSVAIVVALALLIDRRSARAWRAALLLQALALAVLLVVVGETALVAAMALANAAAMAALLTPAVRAHVRPGVQASAPLAT